MINVIDFDLHKIFKSEEQDHYNTYPYINECVDYSDTDDAMWESALLECQLTNEAYENELDEPATPFIKPKLTIVPNPIPDSTSRIDQKVYEFALSKLKLKDLREAGAMLQLMPIKGSNKQVWQDVILGKAPSLTLEQQLIKQQAKERRAENKVKREAKKAQLEYELNLKTLIDQWAAQEEVFEAEIEVEPPKVEVELPKDPKRSRAEDFINNFCKNLEELLTPDEEEPKPKQWTAKEMAHFEAREAQLHAYAKTKGVILEDGRDLIGFEEYFYRKFNLDWRDVPNFKDAWWHECQDEYNKFDYDYDNCENNQYSYEYESNYTSPTLADAYVLLGLGDREFSQVTKNEARQAYWTMARIHHPDNGGSDEAMIALNNARELVMSSF